MLVFDDDYDNEYSSIHQATVEVHLEMILFFWIDKSASLTLTSFRYFQFECTGKLNSQYNWNLAN
jgi:hypothetical protein